MNRESMNNWKSYWQNMHQPGGSDHQTQVARTRNGIPINEKDWRSTHEFVFDNIFENIGRQKNVLDACGGNGLFAIEMLKIGHKVTVVDINTNLLKSIKIESSNLQIINSDLVEFLMNTKQHFDVILIYAGIQYFSEDETVKILRDCKRILNSPGILYIGDIPDIDCRNKFLLEKKRFLKYFELQEKGISQIGTWFKKEWFSLLSEYLQYESCTVITQPEYQIYADFRFDLILRNSK
jgi:ubiquinone/menaquinone biosynthesis C-methylase UbiE